MWSYRIPKSYCCVVPDLSLEQSSLTPHPVLILCLTLINIFLSTGGPRKSDLPRVAFPEERWDTKGRRGLEGLLNTWEIGKVPRNILQDILTAPWGTTSGLKCASSIRGLPLPRALQPVRNGCFSVRKSTQDWHLPWRKGLCREAFTETPESLLVGAHLQPSDSQGKAV